MAVLNRPGDWRSIHLFSIFRRTTTTLVPPTAKVM